MYGPDDEPIVVEIEDITTIDDADLGDIIYPQ